MLFTGARLGMDQTLSFYIAFFQRPYQTAPMIFMRAALDQKILAGQTSRKNEVQAIFDDLEKVQIGPNQLENVRPRPRQALKERIPDPARVSYGLPWARATVPSFFPMKA